MIRFTIEAVLKEHGKTRYWLAKEIGTDFNTINNLVSNKAKAVHIKTLDKICVALDCRLEDILTFQKDKDRGEAT